MEPIFITGARLSFPAIAEPQAFEGSDKRMYGATFLLPMNDPQVQKFMQAVNEVAVTKWADKAPAVLNMINAERKLRGYSRGEEHIDKKTMATRVGYEGMFVITAKKDRQPQIIDASGKGVDPANLPACQAIARKLYGGCYVNVVVKPWAQDNKFGRGVRTDFIAIQFAKDGDPFGEGVIDASNMFAPTAPAEAAAAMPWGAPAAAPAMPATPFPWG